jgi:hypothetical protein
MPRVKPGLSITTRTSGWRSTTALAVKRMSDQIFGIRRGIALKPMIEKSSIE